MNLALANEIILGLYDQESGSPRSVAEVLAPIASLFNGIQAALISRSPTRAPLSALIRGREAIPEFERRYVDLHRLDPFVSLPQERACLADEFIGEARWQSSEFYRRFLRPQNVHHVLGADFQSAHGTLYSLRICRAADGERFTREDADLLEFLVPHLRMASKIRAQQQGERATWDVLEKTAERLGLGVVILDQAGSVLQTNRVASQYLEGDLGLFVANGRLRASSSGDSAKLRTAITLALEASRVGSAAVTGAFVATALKTGQALGLLVRSLPAQEAACADRAPAAAVLLRDALQRAEISQPVLQELFSLSRCEARVGILLCAGFTLDEVAEQVGVSRNTVRTHLQTLFQKTGTTRQSEAVRMLLGSVVSI
jgi:DNA-binding CsgD family transcriptional regulator